jgi:hypothetical protein
MEKICEQCGIIFNVNEKNKRHRNRRFCGPKCSSSHNGKKNKGRKHSDEVNKTKGLSGSLNPMFGKSHSIELRNQITLSKLKTNLKNVKNCNLSEIEKEVLDGIMISDGCLTSTTSISARLSLGFKYSETLEDIKKSLPSIDFGKTNVSKDGKSFHNKSKMYGDLLSENERWYKDKVKIIPDDFRLTQTSCYWWFIGDGYNVDGNVFLCTDSYDKEYNEKIIKRINDLGFKCNLTSRNRIRFYKDSSLNFLKWITPKNGINQQYIYKWKKK